ncbi:hypothetical protein CDD83_510 [Cordyceps sp. RAO-2017]|nr:hypothetical protein CDD83_510 [Cordyceps sp. RAO-2017]
MVFSSASDVLLFTFEPSALVGGETGARIQPPGIDADGEMLTYGLDFAKTKDLPKTKLSELLKWADTTSYAPSEILDLDLAINKPAPNDPAKRNALWFVPVSNKRITMRLQFQMAVFDPLKTLLGAGLKGLTLTSADVIFRREMLLAETEQGDKPLHSGEVAFSIECSVKADAANAPEVSMVAGVEFFPSSINLTFMFLSEKPLEGILKWLAGLVGDNTLESFVDGILNKQEDGKKVLPTSALRRMTIGLSTLEDPKTPKLSSFSFDIEVSANFGGGSDKSPVLFLISYNWDSFQGGFGTLAGQLWNEFDSSRDLDLQPYQEKWTILQPVTPSPATAIDIATLIPTQTIVDIPETLPSQITLAYVELSQDSFAIRCTVATSEPSADSVPQPSLGEVVLDASFAWGQSSAFTLKVGISAILDPGEDPSADTPALLTGSLNYDSSKRKWDLQGSLSGLYASSLVDFFDEEAKSHVRPLIESIAIDTLTAQYTYESGGANKSNASNFNIEGDLLIASLRLGLSFTYDKQGFVFAATLKPDNKSATLGDVLLAILGSDVELPYFVYDTEIIASGQNLFSINVKKTKTVVDKVDKPSFQFLAQLSLGDLRIDFAQLHGAEWGATTPSKRLVKVAIKGFAGVEIDIPLIGTLTQPLDELYFLWVQDPPPPQPVPGKVPGLMRLDIDQLNDGLPDRLLVKDKIKPEQRKPTDVLVTAGCHFAVVIRSATGELSCLLDYEFLKPTASGTRSGQIVVDPRTGARGTKRLGDAEPDDGGPSAQEPYKKVAGPLSISNVGLKYKDKRLAIMFDATFELGPIGFSLLGFSLGAAFVTLDKAPTITPDLEGLAVVFDKPPLSIEGAIRHGNDGGMEYFAGGLVVGWKPYQFQAAGFYGTVKPKGSSDSFRTIFVFAKLNGPLVTLEFAEITSVCGGFGYNSSVRVPTVDEVYQFPFIASDDLRGNDNALQVLEKIVDPSPGSWFQPLDQVYWAAVGLKVGAFQMLSVDAVLVVQFGQSVRLGVFAVALADIPTPKSPIKLAHVELGISAVIDFDYGTLKIESQLSPRSYILSPDCHLTGGAALYYWFDAPHADQSSVGQFVFTLGGYHQAYRVPVGYPNPPRLGISWSLGGGLKVSGQAYFAITPKACMAGGHLHASFSAGPISAWFDAFADFLINYKPFYFNMQAGVSVGVGFSIDIWFIHIRISVEIGAALYLWGPPLAGRVHVDFWIVAFDINFGDSGHAGDSIDLNEFYLLVLQTSSSSSLASPGTALLGQQEEKQKAEAEQPEAQTTRPKNEAHNFLPQSGLLNPTDKPERQQNEAWLVRAGSFCFVVECKMAVNHVKTDAGAAPIITYGDAEKGIDIFSKPMKLVNPMTSTLVVQITQGQTSDDNWQYDKYMKSVPRALWAKYDSGTDPRSSGNNINDLLKSDDGSLPLMMGVQITAPKPTISPDPFPAFKVADADLQSLIAERLFPQSVDTDAAWAPTESNADVKKQYQDALDGWTNPAAGADMQKGFVGALADCLKWDNVKALQSIAGIPERLKNGFMDSYVAAPLLTA